MRMYRMPKVQPKDTEKENTAPYKYILFIQMFSIKCLRNWHCMTVQCACMVNIIQVSHLYIYKRLGQKHTGDAFFLRWLNQSIKTEFHMKGYGPKIAQ